MDMYYQAHLYDLMNMSNVWEMVNYPFCKVSYTRIYIHKKRT